MSKKPIVAVLQFPGSNSESETVRALQHVGLDAETFRWNRSSDELERYDGYVVPGGFAYEDRIRAGVIPAKEPLMDQLAQEAENGKPVLGICNGAQTLLESGLLPGLNPGSVEMALAHNYTTYQEKTVRSGHHCSWVNLRCEAKTDRTPFTRKNTPGTILPMVVSHGEGRFISADDAVLKALEEQNLVVWRYCDHEGTISEGLPVNPNGAFSNIAGICNPKGNVVALMPHPERSYYLRQVPSNWCGEWGSRRRDWVGQSDRFDAPGPGYFLFESLAEYLMN